MKQLFFSTLCLTVFLSSLTVKAQSINAYLDTTHLKAGEERYVYLAEHLKEINNYHYDTVSFFSKEAREFADSTENERVLALSYFFTCSSHTIHRRFSKALEEAQFAEQLFLKVGDSINLARLYNEFGYIYWQLSFREKSLSYYTKSVQLAGFEVWDIYFTAKANIANAMGTREPKTAKKLFLDLLTEIPNSKPNQKAVVFNALFFPIAMSRDSLRLFMDSAHYYNRITGNKISRITTLFNESKWEHIHYRIDSAIAFTNEALKLAKELNDTRRIAVCFRFLLTRHLVKGNYEKANIYLDSLSNILAKDRPLKQKMSKNYFMLQMELYAQQGKYKKAVDLMNDWFFYDDSTDKAMNAQRIYALQTEFETREKAWKIQQLKEENKIQQISLQRSIAIGVGLVLSLIVILLFLFMKKRQDRIKAAQEKLQLEWKLNDERKEKEKISLESHYKSQQLISKSLQLSKKNEFLENVQQEVGQASLGLQQEDQQKLHRLHQLIRLNQQSDKEWQEIRQYFDQLDPLFFNKMKQKHGAFSQAEQRLLALIYLKLDTKDCANILSISSNSVKTARYRLKKRLGLRAEESLDEYVQQIEQ